VNKDIFELLLKKRYFGVLERYHGFVKYFGFLREILWFYSAMKYLGVTNFMVLNTMVLLKL
jgi:hypothetical protein